MTGFCSRQPPSSSKSHRSAMARWADVPLSAPPTLCAAVQTEAGDREHLERAAPRQRSAGVQVGLSAFWKPVHAWPPSHVALWTAPSSDALSTGEWEELLNLSGWVFELHSIPLLMTYQIRVVLRAWQADLRWRLAGRPLRWPFSFLVYGLIF